LRPGQKKATAEATRIYLAEPHAQFRTQLQASSGLFVQASRETVQIGSLAGEFRFLQDLIECFVFFGVKLSGHKSSYFCSFIDTPSREFSFPFYRASKRSDRQIYGSALTGVEGCARCIGRRPASSDHPVHEEFHSTAQRYVRKVLPQSDRLHCETGRTVQQRDQRNSLILSASQSSIHALTSGANSLRALAGDDHNIRAGRHLWPPFPAAWEYSARSNFPHLICELALVLQLLGQDSQMCASPACRSRNLHTQ